MSNTSERRKDGKKREKTHKARRTRTVRADRILDGFVFPLEERLTSRTPRPEDIAIRAPRINEDTNPVLFYFIYLFACLNNKYSYRTGIIVSERNHHRKRIRLFSRVFDDVFPVSQKMSEGIILQNPSFHVTSLWRVPWRPQSLVVGRFSLSSYVGRQRFLRARGARRSRPRPRPRPRPRSRL